MFHSGGASVEGASSRQWVAVTWAEGGGIFLGEKGRDSNKPLVS